ncbi:MAG: VOC family protein [Planctomycetota bacterium]
MTDSQPLGSFGWIDLTVDDAIALRDFYSDVAGWTSEGIQMTDDEGGYEDFVMMNSAGVPVGGVCHRRGGNSDQPTGWINYVTVPDLAASVERATKRGAAILSAARRAGAGKFQVLRDPAGATFALYQAD